jgi:hypothetical protein
MSTLLINVKRTYDVAIPLDKLQKYRELYQDSTYGK